MFQQPYLVFMCPLFATTCQRPVTNILDQRDIVCYKYLDRAMAHTICRQPPTTEAPVLFRTVPCDICGKPCGIEKCFPPGILLNHERLIRNLLHAHTTFVTKVI